MALPGHPSDTVKKTAPAEQGDMSRPASIQAGDSGEQEAPKERPASDEQPPAIIYPKRWELALLTFGICLTIFLVSLDFSILATAIPKITAEFKSLEDVGWYGSAYLLTASTVTLLMGKFYSVFNLKWVFLIALLLFEVGSVICAAAPSSVVLIFGRAVAGCGNAGLLSGALLILTNSVPLERRSMFISMTGGTYGIAAIAGPPLGGAFTDRLTWRWCFWINLPIGAVTFLAVIFLFKSPKRAELKYPSVYRLIMRFDPLGTIVFMPAIVCILLALQWGGTTYAWGSGTIIALFVVAGVLLVAFGIIQWRMGDDATVPLRIITKRTIWSCAIYQFTLGAGFFIFIYFVPIWFQAVRGSNAVQSGLQTLPMLVGNIVATAISGVLVAVLGHYAPFMIAGTVVTSVGAGLTTLFGPDTTTGMWIGYQALVGLGIGLGWQQPLVAVQTALDLRDVPIATATLSFSQTLGGTIFVSAAQTVFSNKLVQELANRAPGLDPSIVLDGGATDLAGYIPGQYLSDVLLSYNNGLQNAFIVGTAMVALSVFGCGFVEWNSVKGKKIEATVA